MKQQKISGPSIHNWWKLIIKQPLPIFKDWLTKENIFLRKNIKRNSKILDVGCGAGRHIKLLANIAKEISGVDWDKEVIKEARKNSSRFKNVKIFFEDAKKMHFKNNVFDFVICMGNTFGDFGKNTLRILKEMKRVSQEYVVISLPHSSIFFSLTAIFPFIRTVFKKRYFNFFIKIPQFFRLNQYDGQHYWEMGRHGTSKNKIKIILKKYFEIEKEFQPFLNFYHYFFILKIKE